MKTIKEMIEVMEWFDKGGKVERVEKGSDNWVIADNPQWNWCDYEFRIKKLTYPMWFKANLNGLIIKFDGLQSGIVVEEGNSFYTKGEYSSLWTPHTDSKYWEEIEEPKSKQTITMQKWLMRRSDEYYVLTTNKISNYNLSTQVKLLGTYEIEI